MKKQIITIIVTLLIPLISIGQTTYVLSTGVSNYGDEHLNLRNSSKDAKAFGKLFQGKKNTKVSVVTSSNATKENIMTRLKAIKLLAKPEDKVIFFFSGHGDTNCFIAFDLPITYNDIIQTLKEMKTPKVFFFIDACNSGSVQDVTTEYQWSGEAGSSISFMMSSRASEYSFENQWLENGFFTQALLKALRGKADADGNKDITLMECFKYVHADVVMRCTEKQQQHPQLISNKSLYDEVIISW